MIYSVLFLEFIDGKMDPYWDQERTRPFHGPLFQQQANPEAGYYLDQGLMISVNLVCIESTGEILMHMHCY